jgi:hypothetical protein
MRPSKCFLQHHTAKPADPPPLAPSSKHPPSCTCRMGLPLASVPFDPELSMMSCPAPSATHTTQ